MTKSTGSKAANTKTAKLFDMKPLVSAIITFGDRLDRLFVEESLRTAKLFDGVAFDDGVVTDELNEFIQAHQASLMDDAEGSPRATWIAKFGNDSTFKVYAGRSSASVAGWLKANRLPKAVTTKHSLAKLSAEGRKSGASPSVKGKKGSSKKTRKAATKLTLGVLATKANGLIAKYESKTRMSSLDKQTLTFLRNVVSAQKTS